MTQLVLLNRDEDAAAIGELYRKARTTMVDSVKYLVDAGCRLIAKKESLDHGEWLPWLADHAVELGFDSRFTAAKLMKIAEKCAVNGTFDEAEALRLNRIAWGNNVRGTEGTGENEWFTPDTPLWPIITMARAVLGGIDLDPATHEQAQKIIQAAEYFTKDDDGLAHEWHGRVWLNPPYAPPLIGQFINKLLQEWGSRRITACIALTHNYTDTAWFHDAGSVADAVCFTQGRVRFYEPSGDKANPTQGQAFFYFGPNVDLFTATFESIGLVMEARRRR